MDDIYVIVNRRIADLTDRTKKYDREVSNFVNGLLLGTLPKDICVVCDRPPKEQDHHPVKRIQDEELTVPVCRRCHTELTEDQKLWDWRRELPNQPDNVRKACLLYGVSDICRRRSRILNNPCYEVYANLLRTDIDRLLKGN